MENEKLDIWCDDTREMDDSVSLDDNIMEKILDELDEAGF